MEKLQFDSISRRWEHIPNMGLNVSATSRSVYLGPHVIERASRDRRHVAFADVLQHGEYPSASGDYFSAAATHPPQPFLLSPHTSPRQPPPRGSPPATRPASAQPLRSRL